MELFYGKYRKESLLGRGAFSEVWKVTDVQTGVVQAVKIYSPTTAIGDDGIEMMKHEFAIMANANHQNLLRPLYFDICDHRPFLVLSFCKNGNIKSKTGRFSEHEAWQLLRDAASGLAYLHAMNPPVIHQDIKPDNILIADNGSLMLTDFGVSIKAMATMSRMSNDERLLQSAGTLPYMPPEKFSKNNLPIMAGDIWSLGVTAYEMLTGHLPFCQGELQGGLLQRLGAEVPELQGDYSQALKDIITQCMSLNAWDRPQAAELEEVAIEAVKAIEPQKKTPTHATFKKTLIPKVEQAASTIIEPMQHPVTPVILSENPAIETHEPVTNRSNVTKFLLGAVSVCLLLTVGFFGIKSLLTPSSQTSSLQKTPPAESLTMIPETSSASATQEEIKNDEQASESSAAAVSGNDDTKPVSSARKNEQRTPKATYSVSRSRQESTVEHSAVVRKPIKSNLSYASWSGSLADGKPTGIGTMVFTDAATIRCSNGTTIFAQAGDRIEKAEFDDSGYLYQGKWIKKDGETKTITP